MKRTIIVIPNAQISLNVVTCAAENNSGDIQREEPADDDVVIPPVSSNILERPKSLRRGVPCADTRMLP